MLINIKNELELRMLIQKIVRNRNKIAIGQIILLYLSVILFLNYLYQTETTSNLIISFSKFIIFVIYITIPVFRVWTKGLMKINIPEKTFIRWLYINSAFISTFIFSICLYLYNLLYEWKGNLTKPIEDFTNLFYFSVASLILFRIWLIKIKYLTR